MPRNASPVESPCEDLDLSMLPEHLHERARNLEAEANRCQRHANEMEQHARVFAITYFSRSILGEENG